MSVYNQSIIELSAADYLLIKEEHKMLEKYFMDLRDVCTYSASNDDCHECDLGKQASCLGRLPSFLFHITDLADRHFDFEEDIMLSHAHDAEQYENIRIHHQAHENMMLKLHQLAEECLSLREQGNTQKVYQYFYEKIADLFEKHERNFDDPFIKLAKT